MECIKFGWGVGVHIVCVCFGAFKAILLCCWGVVLWWWFGAHLCRRLILALVVFFGFGFGFFCGCWLGLVSLCFGLCVCRVCGLLFCVWFFLVFLVGIRLVAGLGWGVFVLVLCCLYCIGVVGVEFGFWVLLSNFSLSVGCFVGLCFFVAYWVVFGFFFIWVVIGS